MELYILKPIENLPDGDNPWNPWFDKCYGMVIRAKNEKSARNHADKKAGDENRGEFLNKKISNTKHPWLDKKYTTCEILSSDGKNGIIIQNIAFA